MKFYIPLFLVLFNATNIAFGQQCDCHITLTNLKQTSLNLIWASQLDYVPGDTICIPAGNYAGIRFYNFQGTASAPLTIKNCGGRVEISETNYSGISFNNSKHIRLTGAGDSLVNYGIYIKETSSPASVGVGVEHFSSDIEIDHLEIANTGFAGIMAKTDPTCSNSSTWRRNGFVLENLNVHHNYIHHTGGEGIYVGFTGGYKINSNRSCDGDPIFGHWLRNIDIHHNRLENIGWDGVQVNLVNENGKIHHNTLINYGLNYAYAQNFAMSIGAGVYEIYNNYIDNSNGTGLGLQLISAASGTKVHNNVIIRPGLHGVFLHNRHAFDNANEGYYVVNNTIIEPENAGILYNTAITETGDPNLLYTTQETVPSFFVNNLITDPGNDFAGSNTWKGSNESYIDFNRKIERDSSASRIYSNLLTRAIDTLGLEDVVNNNYRPSGSNSALVDAGFDASVWGIAYAMDGISRPQNASHDIGAYEYIAVNGYRNSVTDSAVKISDDGLINSETPNVFNPFRLEDYEVLSFYQIDHTGQFVDLLANRNVSLAYEDLDKGLYFLRVVVGKELQTHRFMIRG